MPSLFSARRPPRRRSPAKAGAVRSRSAVLPTVTGLLVGLAVQIGLPAPVFRSVTLVAPEAGGPKNTADLHGLAEFALSRPVLRAAAAALVAGKVVSPMPGPMERLGLIRLDAEADRAARLADQLAVAGHAAPSGEALIIGAESAEPVRAAHLAQALAVAFVSKRAEAVVSAQRKREMELASRIAAAEAAATTARKRFLAAGGADVGTEKARAAAAAEVRDADARIARLRKIVASGSPPVADDAAATQAISDLQANYVDLQGKLAQALQTLGERHTTVITLRDSIRRSASELSAAWTRQLRSAEADRDAAKLREAVLFRADPGKDAGKQAALEEARRNKDAADAALLRAEAELDFLPDEPAFHVRTSAAVPARSAEGWSALARSALASFAGMAAFAALIAGRIRAARFRHGAPASMREPIPQRERTPGRIMSHAGSDTSAILPEAAMQAEPADTVWTAALRTAPAPDHPTPIPMPMTANDRRAEEGGPKEPAVRFFRAAAAVPMAASLAGGVLPEPADPVAPLPVAAMVQGSGQAPGQVLGDDSAPADPVRATAAMDQLATLHDCPGAEPPRAPGEVTMLRDLQAAFRDLVDALRGVAPANGPIPTLMIASHAADGGTTGRESATTDVTLALGEAAASAGLRVLLVEATRRQASLSEHAAMERRPTLVGMRDGLRLVFAADAVAGLFLAPLFSRRAQLVAALSRHRRAQLVESAAAHYDVLLIDAGDAAAAARAGWTADRYLRVGGEATLAASARFLAALGHPAGDFAGTVVGATFVPAPRSEPARLAMPARPERPRADPVPVAA